jgi:hypothetical protein
MRVRAEATWVSRDEDEAQRAATDSHHLGGVAADRLDVRCQRTAWRETDHDRQTSYPKANTD